MEREFSCAMLNRGKMGSSTKSKKPISFSNEPLHLTCEWENCSVVEDEVESLISHLALEHISKLNEGDLHCHWKDCEGFTESFAELRRHILFHVFHTKIKCFGANLQNRKKLPNCLSSIHSRNIVPELPEALICGWQDCLTMYECAEHFYRHVDSHAKYDSKKVGQNSAICLWEGCNRTFNDQYKVKEHLRSHTQEKVIACPTCGGMFASSTKFFDHLQRQLSVEDKEAYYICEYCSKKTSSERLLRDHMRHHVNHYKCPYCDMTCPTPSDLQTHLMYRHSNSKPHSCSYCDYSAKTENDLRKHLECHSLASTYKCHVENCSYSTRSHTCFKVHNQKVHEKKDPFKYSCHICEKLFTRGNYLTKHLLKVHKFHWPSGHCRFRYNLNEDGCYRLQTVRYESLELSEAMLGENTESIDDPDAISKSSTENDKVASNSNYENLNTSKEHISNKQVLHSSNPVINGSVVVCIDGGQNTTSFNISDSNLCDEKAVLINIIEASDPSMPANLDPPHLNSVSTQSQNMDKINNQTINIFSDINPNFESLEEINQYESLFL